MPDPIKDAFSKVKEDMLTLRTQLTDLKIQLEEIKRTLQQTNQQTDRPDRQTNRQITPTDNHPLYPLKPQDLGFSTGNRGVPTDRQTNQQTDRQTQEFAQYSGENPSKAPQNPQNLSPPPEYQEHRYPSVNTQESSSPIHSIHHSISSAKTISSIEKASQMLESLDTIKRDIRSQFKRLTSQEMLIFSTIYQLEDQGLTVDYPLLAERLNLSESSIRDYVLKITKKGIPVGKTKENNKKVTLSILPELRKIASLQTILSLREL